jgi:hypothetical protein
MSTEPTATAPVLSLPPDVQKRLNYWHGLWHRSAQYHYFFGVVSVAASVISTSLDGNWAKPFSIIAAITTALIGFMHPERRYFKFVRAWRVLDLAAMRYRHGLIERSALIDAVAQGEALIAELEDKIIGGKTEPEVQLQSQAQAQAAAEAEANKARIAQDAAGPQSPGAAG